MVLQFYPVYLRRAILKAAVEEGLVINNKKQDPNQTRLNLNDTLDVTDDETLDKKISHILQNEEICAFIEEYEYRKAYKHFCYFQIAGVDVERIKKLAEEGIFNVFSKTSKHCIDDSSKPTIFSNGDNIFLKFSYILKNYEGVEIKYVMLAILDINNSLLEIRFDKIGLAFKETETFYKDKISKILEFINTKLGIVISNIDFKAIVEYMIREEKEISVIAQQMTRNGTTAYLQADEDDNTIPILGELDRFIKEEDGLFSRSDDTRELKQRLQTFIDNIKIKSDLPKVIIRFEEFNVKIGISHNYKGTDFSLFLLYGDLLREKEVMGNVRKYLMQCREELNSLAPSFPVSS